MKTSVEKVEIMTYVIQKNELNQQGIILLIEKFDKRNKINRNLWPQKISGIILPGSSIIRGTQHGCFRI